MGKKTAAAMTRFEELRGRGMVPLDMPAIASADGSKRITERFLALRTEAAFHGSKDEVLWQAILADIAEWFPWAPPAAPTRRVSQTPSGEDVVRRAARVLAMVHELHKAGYQRIRVSPGIAPNGSGWRCNVTHASNIDVDGFTILNFSFDDGETATYSSTDGSTYFGWTDGAQLTARQMAQRFLEAYPKIAKAGAGRDWLYAGWLTDVLGRAEQGTQDDLVRLYADYGVDEQELERWRAPPP